jgi:hypothetical protein
MFYGKKLCLCEQRGLRGGKVREVRQREGEHHHLAVRFRG